MKNLHRRWLLGLCFVGLLGGAGCGAPQAAKVDAGGARKALTTALDAWKEGRTIESLKTGSPAITAQDMDWEAGQKLVSYEVKSDGKDDDANLRIPVELVLQDKGGRETRKKVNYVVGTSPAVTVFRELF